MLGAIKPKQALAVAIEHRVRRDHLSVEKRPPRQEPQEVAAVAGGPLHHRRDTKAVRAREKSRVLLSHLICKGANAACHPASRWWRGYASRRICVIHLPRPCRRCLAPEPCRRRKATKTRACSRASGPLRFASNSRIIDSVTWR